MDLIYANAAKEDIGVLSVYAFDLAFGADENNFECTVSAENNVCEAGYYLYIEGTEYGGIIDAVVTDTANGEVKYCGRTWHGILNSKVICPDEGQDYYTVSGDANSVIGALVSRLGLSAMFSVASVSSPLTVSNYKFDRYISAYNGIKKMLAFVGGKLLFSFAGGVVTLSAVPAVMHGEEVDSDLVDFEVRKTKGKVNHLICLGSGDLAAREVVHLYADTSGNISQTQTITGIDEYVAVYEYGNAESTEELIKGGKERFAELLAQDSISLDLNADGDIYDVGDSVVAVDNMTGIAAVVPINKKIVSINNGLLTISYETDAKSVTTGSTGEYGAVSGGTGTFDHAQLQNRDADNQHPVSAITGLSSAISNRNLLDNGWFTVNQRGKTNYSDVGYFVDRWYAEGTAGVTVDDDGITLGVTGLPYIQMVEKTVLESISGKTVTASIMFADGTIVSGTGIAPAVTSGNTNATILSSDFADFVISVFGGSKSYQICRLTVKQSKKIRAIKLEIGGLSTIANDAIPEYSAELAECQRYYMKLPYNNTLLYGTSGASDGTAIRLVLPTPVTMRTNPTVSAFIVNVSLHSGAVNNVTYTPSAAMVSVNSISFYGSASIPISSSPTYVAVSAQLRVKDLELSADL